MPVLLAEPVPVPVPVADDEAFDELDDDDDVVVELLLDLLELLVLLEVEVLPVPPAPPVLLESPQPVATPKRPRSTVAKPRTLITLITPPFAPYDARPVWRRTGGACKSSARPKRQIVTEEGLADPMDTFSCPHHPTCPGCPFLGLSYEEQLARKASHARDALAGYPELAEVAFVPPMGAVPAMGYRTRLKWVAAPGGRLGLYRRGTHEVVDTPDCVVAKPVLRRAGDAARKALRQDRHRSIDLALTALDLRQVETDEERVLATLVLRDDRTPLLPQLEAFARELALACPEIVSVGWSTRAHGSAQVLGHGGGILVGGESALDRVGTVEVVARPGSFIQAHRGQAAAIERALVDDVRALAKRLGRAPRVLELFAGSGALGLALSAAGAEVTAVESFAPAARAIGEAAARASLRVTWHAADAEAWVRARRDESYDLVLVDPPRRGLPPGLRLGLVALGVTRLAYVSCAPATLARDLADLARMGLRARSVQPLDMFPLTDHVEAIAFAERGEPPHPRVLYEDPRFIAVDKPPHEPMRSLVERATRVCPTAAPLTTLPSYASGPVLFAKKSDDPSLMPLEIGRTVRIDARAVVKGITSTKGSVGRPLRSDPEAPRTRYERLRVIGGHSLVRLHTHGDLEVPLTHLSMLGHPCVGDPKRGDEPTRRHFFEKHGLDRACVFVESLSFEHAGERVSVAGLEPADLAAVLTSLDMEPTAKRSGRSENRRR